MPTACVMVPQSSASPLTARNVQHVRPAIALQVLCSADAPGPPPRYVKAGRPARGTCVVAHAASTSQARTNRRSSDGGAGGGGGDPPKQISEGDDDESESARDRAEADAILAKAGVSSSSLPADLQDALMRGVLTAEVAQRWLWLSAVPALGQLARLWPAFRDKCLGNPRFLVVLLIELAMGCSAKMSAEYRARGDNFWKELNFVASDLALEIVGDCAIVWLLSPAASFSRKPAGALGSYTASLPAFATQRGAYSLGQRASTFLLRGLQFLVVGFGASVVGHGATKAMVEQQERASGEKSEKELAGIIDNSLGWGSFMLLSSNTRYQLVGTIEERLLDTMAISPAQRTGLSFILRFGNTYIGSEQWVKYAAMIGLQ